MSLTFFVGPDFSSQCPYVSFPKFWFQFLVSSSICGCYLMSRFYWFSCKMRLVTSLVYRFRIPRGGHFHINLTGRAVFQGIHFQHKFVNGGMKLIRNSETGYDYLFKNKRLLFSRTIGHCFPYCFPFVL